MKRLLFISILIMTTACAPLEITRLLGVGTGEFEKQGKNNSAEFDLDYFSCFNKAQKSIQELKANIYRGSRKKGFFVAMNFTKSFKQANDSTEVAVFFKEISENKTRVTVSSLNYKLADFAAEKVFGFIAGTAAPAPEPENPVTTPPSD